MVFQNWNAQGSQNKAVVLLLEELNTQSGEIEIAEKRRREKVWFNEMKMGKEEKRPRDGMNAGFIM